MRLELPLALSEYRCSVINGAAARLEAEYGEGVLGLVLSGSAGRGLDTEHSDLDVLVILEAEIVNGPRAPRVHTAELELIPLTLEHLETVAGFNGSQWGYRWSYAWAPVLADFTEGRIPKAIERQTHLTDDETMSILVQHQRLDGWINLVYRALKSVRDGNTLEAELDAAEAIPVFLDVIFGLNGLVRPYNKYLVWALHNHPLADWSTAELLTLIQQMREANPQALRYGLKRVHETALRFDETHNQDSLRAVFEGWSADEYAVLRVPD